MNYMQQLYESITLNQASYCYISWDYVYICVHVCMYISTYIYVCRYIHIYVMFTLVHHLLKKRLIMRSTIGVISQVVNMGINIKFDLLIAKSATFIKTAKLCQENKVWIVFPGNMKSSGNEKCFNHI